MEADEQEETLYTVNQVVAYNLAAARKSKGWTQTEAASRMAPFLGTTWSKASLSAAERSFSNPERIRQFTADDILAFASAFELPIQYFFIPPVPNEGEVMTLCSGEGIPGAPLPLAVYLETAFGSEEGIKRAERRLAAVLKATPDVDGRNESWRESMHNLTRARATTDELMTWHHSLMGLVEMITRTLIERDVGDLMRNFSINWPTPEPRVEESEDDGDSPGGEESS